MNEYKYKKIENKIYDLIIKRLVLKDFLIELRKNKLIKESKKIEQKIFNINKKIVKYKNKIGGKK